MAGTPGRQPYFLSSKQSLTGQMKRFLTRLPDLNINIIIALAALYILVANNQSFWGKL